MSWSLPLRRFRDGCEYDERISPLGLVFLVTSWTLADLSIVGSAAFFEKMAAIHARQR